jgi:hypothetical protein
MPKIVPEFKHGQRVHVEFDAVIDHVHYHGRLDEPQLVEVKREGNHYTNSVRLEDVTLAEPKDWPPEAGDIWEADGMEYFVRESRRNSGNLSVSSVSAEGNDYFSYEIGTHFKALDPKLVRRRGQVGDMIIYGQ